MPESRRSVIEALHMLIEADSEKVQIHTFQRRPNTCAVARFSTYIGFGFSKVCYPDIWDKETGVEIAMGKALQDLGNKFWEGEGAFDLLVHERREYN